MLILVISQGQSSVGLRIDPVVDVGSIDADQNDLAAALDSDLRVRAERDVSHSRTIGRSLAHNAVISRLGVGRRRPSENCRKTPQDATRLQQHSTIKYGRRSEYGRRATGRMVAWLIHWGI